jgi:hypothetical protein
MVHCTRARGRLGLDLRECGNRLGSYMRKGRGESMGAAVGPRPIPLKLQMFIAAERADKLGVRRPVAARCSGDANCHLWARSMPIVLRDLY